MQIEIYRPPKPCWWEPGPHPLPHPLTPEQTEAARKIFQFLRRSTCLLSFLQKDQQTVAELPMNRFQPVLNLVSKSCRHHPGQLDSIAKLQNQWAESRCGYHKARREISLRSSSEGTLPHYHLGKQEKFVPFNDRYIPFLMKMAFPQDRRNTEWTPTLCELDQMAKQLSSMEELFVWSHTEDGCYIRADLLAHFFYAAGSKTEQLSKIYFCYGVDQLSFNKWSYHVALAVKIKTEDGDEIRVIDPLRSPNSSLSAADWIKWLTNDTLRPLPVTDYGTQKESFAYDQRHGATFQTPITLELKRSAQNVIYISPITLATMDANTYLLAEFRTDQDCRCIYNLSPRTGQNKQDRDDRQSAGMICKMN